jgi:hypothetical protein
MIIGHKHITEAMECIYTLVGEHSSGIEALLRGSVELLEKQM